MYMYHIHKHYWHVLADISGVSAIAAFPNKDPGTAMQNNMLSCPKWGEHPLPSRVLTTPFCHMNGRKGDVRCVVFGEVMTDSA